MPESPNADADFIWYELITPDPDAANAFYGAVVGWRFVADHDPQQGMDYRMIVRDDGGVNGGVLKLNAEMQAGGARPAWMPYLYVPDVATAAAAIVAEGGRQLMPGMTIPEGTFAMLLDPQGVPIYLMTPTPPAGEEDARSDVFDPDKAQHVRWNELASPDQDASMDFYRRHFGFTFDNRMSMGAMGDYCFIEHHGRTLGAIMRQQQAGPAMWLMYFGVPSITAAKASVEASGGTVMMGPHEVPGGGWIIVGTDPQGAAFGLVGPKGD